MLSSLEIESIKHEVINGAGYVVLPDFIKPDEINEVKKEIEYFRSEGKLGHQFEKDNRERFFGIIYTSSVFQAIALRPLEIVRSVLETQKVSLSGFSAHMVKPGLGSIGMHVDYPYGDIPDPIPQNPILGLQLIWAVDEFTADNGATLFCPGTQKLARRPTKTSPETKSSIPVVAKPGSLILAHCLCWHDSGENMSDSPRVGLLGNYTPSYIRPIEFPFFELKAPPDDLRAGLRSLLGLTFYESVVQDLLVEERATENWLRKAKI